MKTLDLTCVSNAKDSLNVAITPQGACIITCNEVNVNADPESYAAIDMRSEHAALNAADVVEIIAAITKSDSDATLCGREQIGVAYTAADFSMFSIHVGLTVIDLAVEQTKTLVEFLTENMDDISETIFVEGQNIISNLGFKGQFVRWLPNPESLITAEGSEMVIDCVIEVDGIKVKLSAEGWT
ncbi:hypothetical protein NVP1244A_121 [Vibrio phage 1.244.A._10N.261.54.C3]|nr:hypothetical protein NVP1244A_121 [Vibrio phage 1.244.A._10N.261.54.C3]AUR98749.1 hypothetical protein NVP1255O_121 [Vibrio phage 1.255.O._10N.286.45.F1]